MQWFSAVQTWWQRSTQTAQPSLSEQWPRSALILGLFATTVVGGLKGLGETNLPGRGWLQGMEFAAYDGMIRLKPAQDADPRIVVVGITEDDIDRYQTPLPDEILAQVLSTLQSYQPRVIGLDLYRNTEHPPGTEALAEQWNAPNLVGILELGTGDRNYVPPPPALPGEQVGFNDLLLDRDRVVRRFMLLASKGDETYFSFALRVAYRYLQDQDPNFSLANAPDHPDGIFWGESLLTPLNAQAGAYQGEDDRAYQLVLNYRTPYDVASVLSISAVLANASTLRDQVHNQIVLIGNVAPSSKDLFFTPYTGAHRSRSDADPRPVASTRNPYSDIYGVNLHAHIISYLLDLAEGTRQPLQVWPEWAEWVWLSLWGFVGAGLSARLQHPLHWMGAVGGSGFGLLGLHYGLLLQNIWVPGIAPLLSLGTGAIGTVLYGNYQVQREKQYLAQQAQAQQASIALLQQLIANNPPSGATDLVNATLDEARSAQGGQPIRPIRPTVPNPGPSLNAALDFAPDAAPDAALNAALGAGVRLPADPNAPLPRSFPAPSLAQADHPETAYPEAYTDTYSTDTYSTDTYSTDTYDDLYTPGERSTAAEPLTTSEANPFPAFASPMGSDLAPTLIEEDSSTFEGEDDDRSAFLPSVSPQGLSPVDFTTNLPTLPFDNGLPPVTPSPKHLAFPGYVGHIPTLPSEVPPSLPPSQALTGANPGNMGGSGAVNASSGRSFIPAARSESPETLGGILANRYQIRSILGEGGFGVTYIAQDQQRPGQPHCVIKRLCPARQDARFLQVARRLFKSEAEILELLGKHDRIPRLLAYFEEKCEFYLVQDFIPGESLSQELQPGEQWPLEKTLEFLRELLSVLDFIHDRQVIHRDLKPSNIMRRQDGKLVLIDFGAVKYLNAPGKDAVEARTIAVGTPGYAAPEQMAGHPQLNSDLYSLGMLAIQGLTGIPPHLLKLDPNTGDLNWRSYLDRSLPLFPILERLTHFNCIDRYPNAAQVLQDLNRL
ncbi:MAG: CHASE2 domain-containing protein [Prochlorothrix sp.]